MIHIKKGQISFYWKSVKDVFSFSFSLGKRTKRTRVFYLLSFLPVVMALVIKFAQYFYGRTDIQGIYIFSNIIMMFYLQFLILLLALFFGSSVCLDELEGKTLTYLTTRPVPKPAIILGKYAAYSVLIVLMTGAGVVFSFLILNCENLGDVSLYKILLRDISVLCLGLISYASFFTFLGTFLKKSVMVGLIFGFGWENVVQYFPGSTQKFTIAHYLKSLLPSLNTGRFSFLLFRLEPTSPQAAVGMLFLITGFFLVLACVIFSFKEYLFED
ncbi:ABC transporter permease [bacterium]|nr:ABC transporter permease [bacterium]